MDFTAYLEAVKAFGDRAFAALNAFDAPVPDYVLILGAVLMVAGFIWTQRRTAAGLRTAYEDTYGPVLISANRRAYQARASLRKAELELEHERQRRRREKRRASTAKDGSLAELRPTGPATTKSFGDPKKIVKLTREYNDFTLNTGVTQ